MAEITERDAKKEILKVKIEEVVSKYKNANNLQDKHYRDRAMKRLAKDDPKLFVEAYVENMGEKFQKLIGLYKKRGKEDQIPALKEKLLSSLKSKKK